MSFLRTVFFIVLGYVIFKWIDRLLSNRRRHNTTNRPRDGRPSATPRRGETTLRYKPGKTRSAVKDSAGEVVDFEEVEQ